jgi:hypothetical protein
VQQALAHALGLGERELPVQAEPGGPAQQGLGEERDLQPGLVVGEGGEGHLCHPGLLADADRVLDAGAAAVAQLEGSDVGVLLVGDEGGVAVAGLAVEDRELGAGVRALAPDDQPRALGPARKVEAIGEPRDLGALAHGGVAAVLCEGVGTPADVGAGEDRAMEVCLGQLLEGELQHLEVIGCGVGGGVAGAKDAGQGLAGLGEVTEQRVKAEAALVGAGGTLLLGIGGEQAGVDVEDQLLGAGPGIPSTPQGPCPGHADRFQQAGVERLQHPVGCRL